MENNNIRHGTIADLINAANQLMALDNQLQCSSCSPPPSSIRSDSKDATAIQQHSRDPYQDRYGPTEYCNRRTNSISYDINSHSSASLLLHSPNHDNNHIRRPPLLQDETPYWYENELPIPYGAQCSSPSNQNVIPVACRECYIGRNIVKPSYSYAQLIIQAISSSESGKMALCNIYKYIINHYDYYDASDKGWQNSIRHNLSLNKNFIKLPRRNEETGKGSYWTIAPERKDELVAQAFKERKQRNFPLLRMPVTMYGINHCPNCQYKDNSYDENYYNQSSSSTVNQYYTPQTAVYNAHINGAVSRNIVNDNNNPLDYHEGGSDCINPNLTYNNNSPLITRPQRSLTDSYIEHFHSSHPPPPLVRSSYYSTSYEATSNENEPSQLPPPQYGYNNSVYNETVSNDDPVESSYRHNDQNIANNFRPPRHYNI